MSFSKNASDGVSMQPCLLLMSFSCHNYTFDKIDELTLVVRNRQIPHETNYAATNNH